MLDRQDLDALLVGALYGELTPAESDRLAQHLESHPADKTALEDMTRARKAVQESRVFATMAEPPQAVSALLLQEAHRRVPKVARTPEPAESWFQRFLKTFVAHPAMAAATMLVLVAGVAGTLYVRTGQLGADESVATTQSDTAPAHRRDVERELDRGAASAAGSSAAFQAQLDDQVGRAAPVAPVASPPAPAADPGPSVTAALQQQQELSRTQNQLAAAHVSHSSGVNGGLVVNRPEPTVKELPGDNEGDADGTVAVGDTVAPATASAPAPTPAKPAMVNGPGAGGAAAPTGQASTPRLAPAQPAAPPPPPADARRDVEKKGDANANVVTDGKDKDASDNSLLAWAKQQHQTIVQLVQQKKCDDVASLALKLQDRAPDYYNQNVATDRAVAPCGVYISDLRARRVDAQKRAAKPANADTSK
jgi:hypothetical protein